MWVSPQAYPSCARAQRHVHADSRAAVDNSVSANHLLSEQIDQQNGCVAFWAVTAQVDGSVEQVAVRAATLADVALGATRALIDRVSRQCAAALQLLAHTLKIHVGVLAEAEGALLMGTRTIACASRGESRTTYQAPAGSLTRTVT